MHIKRERNIAKHAEKMFTREAELQAQTRLHKQRRINNLILLDNICLRAEKDKEIKNDFLASND